MAVPDMSRALRGWTKRREMQSVIKVFSGGKRSDGAPQSVSLPINIQPMPATQVSRKPENQQSWSWWSLVIRDRNFLFKTDDIFLIGTFRYRVEKVSDWRESGFSKYEVIEDYQS